MKKLVRTIIILGIIYIAYTAYKGSEDNGKSFWYNIGVKSKELVDKGVKEGQGVVNEMTNGYTE